jgi:hypothetical protein
VDLFETFKASGGAAHLYYPRNEHWNIVGQRIAATEVAKVIAGSASR